MTRQGIVLLHGIFRTERSMRKLAKFLQGHGYDVLNINFPSTKKSIEEVVELIHPQIDAFAKEIAGPVSFVSYSLGGLIIRAYLHKYRPQHLARVVMMGPPNKGSELADRMWDWHIYKKLYGPAGQQLVTDQAAFGHLFGPVDYDLGIIAGNWTVEPISSLFLPWPNDGKVSVASTELEGMKDHITVPVPHSFLTASRRARHLILRFLQQGSFRKA